LDLGTVSVTGAGCGLEERTELEDLEEADEDSESDSESELSCPTIVLGAAPVPEIGTTVTRGESSSDEDEDDDPEEEEDDDDEAARRLRFLFRFLVGTVAAFTKGIIQGGQSKRQAAFLFEIVFSQLPALPPSVHQSNYTGWLVRQWMISRYDTYIIASYRQTEVVHVRDQRRHGFQTKNETRYRLQSKRASQAHPQIP
jgi:hypothetical protein